MSNDADDDPTIEVRELSPSEIIEVMPILGSECRELLQMQGEEGAGEELNPFKFVSPETQAAILSILRAVARTRSRRMPAELHGDTGGDSK